MRWFILILGLCSLCSADCADHWQYWLKKYTSVSPIAAYNKLSAWPLSQSEFDAVDGELARIPFAMPLVSNQSKVFQSLGLQAISGHSPMPRDKKLLENIATFLKKGNKDSLRIVFAGSQHIEQVFFEYAPSDVAYAAQFLFHGVDFTSPGLKLFLSLTEEKVKPELLKTIREALGGQRYYERARPMENYSLMFHGTKLESYYYYTKIKNLLGSRKVLDSSVNLSTKTILLSDVHGATSTSVIDELPSGACLKKLGFKSVEVAMEGFPSQSEVIGDDLQVKSDVLYYFDEKPLEELTSFPQIFNLLKSHQVIMFPTIDALRKKIADYGTVLSVRMTGLE